MAKWGEGDPRWIVEERPDTINVNNWHWTEKNATLWSKEKLKELFDNFKIDDEKCDIKCQINKCTATGEAYVNNRKGKLIYFYEWVIELKWTGYVLSNVDSCEGTVTIPNLSEENALEEVDITIGIDDSPNDNNKLRAFMHNIGRDKIRKQLGVYIFELKEKFSQGMILPKKDDDVTPTKPIAQAKVKIDMKPLNAENKNTDKNVGVKLDVKSFHTTESFQCRIEDLYNSLTRIEMVTAFTRGHVKLEVFKGGEFSFFGGNITGKFEELIPNKRIKQLWRYKQWPAGYYSNVTMDFDEKEDHTDLILTHDGIPSNEYDTIRLNWKNYYFNMIKETFGFGSFLK